MKFHLMQSRFQLNRLIYLIGVVELCIWHLFMNPAYIFFFKCTKAMGMLLLLKKWSFDIIIGQFAPTVTTISNDKQMMMCHSVYCLSFYNNITLWSWAFLFYCHCCCSQCNHQSTLLKLLSEFPNNLVFYCLARLGWKRPNQW